MFVDGIKVGDEKLGAELGTFVGPTLGIEDKGLQEGMVEVGNSKN